MKPIGVKILLLPIVKLENKTISYISMVRSMELSASMP